MVVAEDGERAAQLRLFEADLSGEAGWREAAMSCDFVLHTASPFPAVQPQNEDELINPAREGTLRVLQAAREAGARKIVLTSSFAAVGYGHDTTARIFDENDWTNIDSPDVQPYMKSKVLAELAAWDLIKCNGGGMELCVINPVGIFGPVMGRDVGTSVGIIKALLEGRMAKLPRLHFGVVDVRDVADLHIRALRDSHSAGERFIASSGPPLSLHEVAMVLRDGLAGLAGRVPMEVMEDAEVRSNSAMSDLVPQLGIVRQTTSTKATELLGWHPRSAQEAIIASAQSLIQRGLSA